MPRTYSARDRANLRRLYPLLDRADIAERYGVSPDAIKMAARKAGAPAKWRQRKWSAADKALLADFYPVEGPAGAAERLGRPLPAVKAQAARQGLRAPDWTRSPERLARLKEAAQRCGKSGQRARRRLARIATRNSHAPE